MNLLFPLIVVIIAALLAFLHYDSSQIIVKEGVVVITGASSGIGKKTAFFLAKNGFHVFAGVRSEKSAEELSKKAKDHKLENSLFPILLDVTKEDQIKESVKKVDEFLSSRPELPLVGVVNNAGMGAISVAEYLNIEHAKFVYDVNVFGVMRMCKHYLPLLRRSNISTIVQMSSIVGVVTPPFTHIYGSSKFALEAYSDALRAEVHKMNVRVVSIQPGKYKSKFEERRLDDQLDKEQMEIIDKYYPFYFPARNMGVQAVGRDPIEVAEKILEVLRVKRVWPSYLIGNERIPFAIFSTLPKFVVNSIFRLMLDQLTPAQK